jgi:hypothetical protein
MKTVSYSIDYSRTNLANKISWSGESFGIEECEPFIDFIRCDDGDDYEFLHSDKGEIRNGSLFMFEAVLDPEDGNYHLCYSADFEVLVSDSTKKFFDALKKSKGKVEMVLGFRGPDGSVLDNCFEEFENRVAKMEKS